MVSEMVSSETRLWHTNKSRFRLDHTGEPGPVTVQIVGYDPEMMAEAARENVARGAQIIDINMGCPAKKVCNRLAGSALMQDEKLVAEILNTVVKSVDVPVTLKTRTGWNSKQPQWRYDCQNCRRCRHTTASDSWPHPRRQIYW